MRWSIRKALKCVGCLGLTALALAAVPVAATEPADEPDGDAAAAKAQAVEFWIGVHCVPLDEPLRSQLDVKSGEGLLVRDVAPDSPAASAGLRRNDVLLSAREKRLTSVADLQQAVNESSASELKIELLRAGKPETVSVKPQARPDLSWPGAANLPQREREALQRWLEDMHRGGGPLPPMALRFFHPGMLLPPGVGGEVQLPDDASVTIFRQGKQPAKITVRQGDKTWEVTADKLTELPEALRPAVEAMLPLVPGRAITMPSPDAQDLAPQDTGPVPEGSVRSQRPRSVDRQLEELNRRLDELRERLNRWEKQNSP
jgi:membrane-associated protease RseP (regulator of RpoE activity)